MNENFVINDVFIINEELVINEGLLSMMTLLLCNIQYRR